MIDFITRYREWPRRWWTVMLIASLFLAAAGISIYLGMLANRALVESIVPPTASESEFVHSTEEAKSFGELFAPETRTPMPTYTPTPLPAEGRIVCPPDHACGDEGMAFYAEMCDMGAIPKRDWPCLAVEAWRSGGEWDYRWFEPDARRENG